MAIAFPALDQQTLDNRDVHIKALQGLVAAPDGVIDKAEEMRVYETDGLSVYRQLPMGVVLPETTEEVSAVLSYCNRHNIKVVARGAGTSLSGGALPLGDSIVVGVSKMNEMLDVDYENRTATVQSGITNLKISDLVSPKGFFYAPDPSSQLACTIAGNVAMNSGGAHCLKYGVTTNNVLGMKLVMMDGSIIDLGGKHLDAPGLDLLGLLIGSEGTMTVVTEVTVRILAKAEGAMPLLMGFDDNATAGACVAAIIGSGIIPVAIEFMDKPAIHASENFAKAGYPLDVEALLIIEVEGSEEEMEYTLQKIKEIAEPFKPSALRVAQSQSESLAIWKGRKSAFGAIGQISPDYLCMDGTIPTSQLPYVLKQIKAIGDKHGFQVANIFHAGDGNLHPLILYNANLPGEIERVEDMGTEILQLCIDVGGCLTGEHGVGVEKREQMRLQFNSVDLAQQKGLKTVFDPNWLMNPHKVFPLEDAPTNLKLDAA
ncbi:MAG: FAD-linked oxidase C-terminal domain-containing protein [Alphaproteobacteria bacterium]